ncbi:putative thioesterase [Neobacillus sp. B4I6]|jgi:fluoroacetyl-CoA thioesterase|uniref:thioesterase family protein n=1 Tax=Neobacillus sp. B4I6 TaxID=3373925 RepID=UPI003D1C144E
MSWNEKAIGKIGISTMVVDHEVTAHHFGNEGVHVLATAMVGLLAEQALNTALLPLIPEGHGIVGVRLQTYHRAPAPIRTNVKASVKITKVNRNFVSYEFQVVTNEGKRLGDGDGESAVIDMARFQRRIHK